MSAVMTEPESLQDLTARARHGDREAFAALDGRLEGRLRAWIVAMTRLHVGPQLEVEEVLQETLVRALAAIGRFEWRGEDSPFTWLCGIAKHAAMKIAHQQSREEALDPARDLGASAVSPSRALRREERFDRLEASLDALDPDYREALRLSRLDGLKVKEIAARMGRSPNAVKHLLARALAQLREKFGDTRSLGLPARRFGGGEARRGDR
jgi:RNA polymerase sigma-70 factor (ECF subfamily)